MSDDRDPIIESCLEELLSGQGPPDMKQRILDAWEAHKNKPVRSPHFRQPTPYRNRHPQPARQHPDRLPQINAGPRRTRHQSQRVSWIGWMTALAVLTGGGFFIFSNPRLLGPSWRTTLWSARIAPAIGMLPRVLRYRTIFKWTPLKAHRPLLPFPQTRASRRSMPTSTPFAEQSEDSGLDFDPRSRSDSLPEMKYGSDVEIVQFIDTQLGRRWREEGVEPSSPATDSPWCRRTYSRLIGRDPSVEELNRFTNDKHREKKRQLVDALCATADFAEYWASAWTNLLIGRIAEDKETDGRQRLEAYLQESILNNTPYDRVVFELISCEGSNSPDAKDYNGAADFLLANMDRDRTAATSRTCQVFLGKQLQCSQCHEHPLSGWSQQQYWQLNAFFRQMQVERVDGGAW